ncbi:hypothetical protein CC85DRAFT_285318 [Cutaneotrichosporon oleaginosum]|uniref:Uncharacterized protein n=1 Tax=Cutaneotrichosporon oleaginosum TaxID=879819 RepID=A0A0J1B4I8_9TREE|nr:uncharacterized protein CC85DRAFT_285318 [Cutaneotrichosporon oleaginosum]KLT42584.1 hypothetical protein CC85DRAFT_285318 [Cutaneotrichosporon oleaginosum]TXT05299.1 hypothetical protein COLE_06619 [Cutaneotrichosporon oleaginosum]
MGLRVEFLSPHQYPTPVPVPVDNGDMIAARAAIRSYTAARGVLPTVWDGAYFPWLLTHVLPPTSSQAEGEAGALASLRVASRLTTRLYAAARRNPRHTPIPAVMSRCYALVAVGSVWTLYAGVLEGDLVVSELATLNAADPEGLMGALGLVRAIAGEAEARRAVLENWLWCLDPPLSASHSASNSSGSLPVTPKSPTSPLPDRYENPRMAPKVPLSKIPTPERPFENPRAAPQTPKSNSPSQSQVHVPSPIPIPTHTQQSVAPPPRPPPRRIPVPISTSPGSEGSGGTSPPVSASPKSPKSEKRMGLALSPTSPIAVGKGRSAILDVGAWRQAVRRPSGTSSRPLGIHRLSRSVG